MSHRHYGVAVIDADTGHTYHENSRALFETMSGIKSVIGTLALEKAAKEGHDIDAFTLPVSGNHMSNGSGDLKRAISSPEKPLSVPVREAISLSTAKSDCVATNVLIDYLEGAPAINHSIKNRLGLSGMELVTNRLDFPGVDHGDKPYQVGMATMLDFARYYQMIWSDDINWFPESDQHAWHQDEHRKVSKARLFGMAQDQLPADADWAHKTGSGSDVTDSTLYVTMMDAGMLRVRDRTLYIAAARTVLSESLAGQPDMVDFEFQRFADQNTRVLNDLGVYMPGAAVGHSVA